MLQRYADYMDNLGPTGMWCVGSWGVVLGLELYFLKKSNGAGSSDAGAVGFRGIYFF